MVLRLVFLTLALSVLITGGGCAPPTMRAEFTPIGAFNEPAQPATYLVPQAVMIQVYFASSPPGFSLRENELTVEPGHKHHILGRIRLHVGDYGSAPGCPLTQKDAILALQKKARQVGGNAVVYAYSPLSQEPEETACSNARRESDYGGGWAVVIDGAVPGAAPSVPAGETPSVPAGETPAAASPPVAR